jgi:hypothetical protein
MSLTPTETTEELSPADKAALELAIEVTRKESPARCRQIDDFLATRDWFDVATFCASCAQSRSLRLPPWQPAPCNVKVAVAINDMDETRGNRAAALLRLRMAAAGVSKWHPNPVHACEEAEQRQAAK